MLNNYLNLIAEQRVNFPNFRKDHYGIPLARRNKTAADEWADIQRYVHARVVNIINRNTPLFTDTEELYYYEFVDTSPAYRTTFTDWKYFYLPVEAYSATLIANDYLPSIKYYDVETETYEVRYPTSQFLYPIARPRTYYIDTPLINQTHPYAEHFIYTGINVSNNNGRIIYEYADYKMLADDITVTYYSEINPKNFEFRSDNVEFFGMREEFSLLEFLDAPPTRLLWAADDLPDYRFSGRITTRQFSKAVQWYEYNVFNNNQLFDKILLPDPPTLKSLEFVTVANSGAQMSLHFPIGYNRQRIIYKQTSSNNKIVLAPSGVI